MIAATFATFTLAAPVCFAQTAPAAPKKAKKKVVRSRMRPVSLDVQPAPEIEAQVTAEVTSARHTLDTLNVDNVLSSAYLVSAIYYHDGFLSTFPVDSDTAAPERRIIGQITAMLTPDTKTQFIRLLEERWAEGNPPDAPRPVIPVNYSVVSGGRRTHQYAVDLFAPEGSTVRSSTQGIVILADKEWDPNRLFSTTSRNGGNAVIVFEPKQERFYRYCHMDSVDVNVGDLVEAGDPIGTVGHTGVNATQAGHGRHLHFEVNEFANGRVVAFDYKRLRTMLHAWRTGEAAGPPVAVAVRR